MNRGGTNLLNGVDRARVALLGYLKAAGYLFVTPTPATHRIVISRLQHEPAKTLRAVFGWSLPFVQNAFPGRLIEIMTEADVLESQGEQLRSRVRASSLEGDLFLHSAFPPLAQDAVFFGPDTYRFAAFLRRSLEGSPPVGALVDVGAGSGAGAIAARRVVNAERTILTDINPEALRIAAVNAHAASLAVETRQTSGVDGVEAADLVIANPPFIAGHSGRTYRDGGDMLGMGIPLSWALDGAKLLNRGGRLLMYTGSPVIDGEHTLLAAIRAGLDDKAFQLSSTELDPDIFGDELQRDVYKTVERIAAIGVTIVKTG